MSSAEAILPHGVWHDRVQHRSASLRWPGEAKGTASGTDESAAHAHGGQAIGDTSRHVIEGIAPIQEIGLVEMVVDARVHGGAELCLVGIKDKIAGGRTRPSGIWRWIEGK